MSDDPLKDPGLTPAREIYMYPLPKSCATEACSSIGIIALTANEEEMAYRRAPRNDAIKLATELAKAALAEVNGAKVSLANGSADSAWTAMTPKQRQLAITAYGDVHNASKEDEDSFLQSRTVRVG